MGVMRCLGSYRPVQVLSGAHRSPVRAATLPGTLRESTLGGAFGIVCCVESSRARRKAVKAARHE
eukprot:12458268-Heterocapsa_arctica.AAC.1